MPGYVYKGDRPFNPEEGKEGMILTKAGRYMAPCGTRQALRRHRARGEDCEVCETEHTNRLTARGVAMKARNEATRAERAEKAKERMRKYSDDRKLNLINRPLKPCGTSAARNRHVKEYQPVDLACHLAFQADNNARSAREREKRRAREAQQMMERA